ncbi:MAG: hypothetical protein H7X80_11560 [bacterium]|nr:hypothetical protein [Candidatus Kapabacteria bacterium]
MTPSVSESSNVKSSEVFGTAAHDMRSPLTVIVALTELMLLDEELDAAEMRKLLEAIRTSAGEIHRILDDMQEISRIERGSIELRRTHVDLDALVLGAATDANVAHILSIDVDDTVTYWNLDSERMQRALMLLLVDALSRSPETIAVHADLQNDDLCIRITDGGPRLDDAALSDLVDSFRRGRRRPTQNASASSLGPAVAARIVEAHNGAITAEHGSITGAVVSVRLPLSNDVDSATDRLD